MMALLCFNNSVPVKPTTARDVLEIARSWEETPYAHQGRLKGVGVDCLGLLIGMWHEIYGFWPEKAPSYTPIWAEAANLDRSAPFHIREPLLDAAQKHLLQVTPAAGARNPRPGDVLLFRVRRRSAVKHCAIQDEDGKVIHSLDGERVLSSAPNRVWLKLGTYVFRWPGVVSCPHH